MQSLQNWLGGGAPDREPAAAGGSVLSQWQQYSGGGGGSAAAPASAAQTDRLLANAEEGAAGAGTAGTAAAGSSVKSMVTSARNLLSGAASSVSAAASGATANIPSTTQWTYFAFFFGGGLLFLAMAFIVFLPMIVFKPAKFAMTFSIGSALLICSLGALKGWKTMFGHLLSRERLPFTGAYFGSLLATLYVSFMLHSYVLSLLFCVAQLVTLVYYVASYFPGGAAGAQSVLGFAGRGAMSLGGAAVRAAFSGRG